MFKQIFMLALASAVLLPAAAAEKAAAKEPFGMKRSTSITARCSEKSKGFKSWNARWQDKAKYVAKVKNDIQILFIGDSITHFWERNAKSNRRGIGGADTYKKYFSKYRLLNIGYSGDRTENTLWMVNESKLLDNIKPALTVVMIGTNNIGHKKAGPEATAAGIKLIVESIRKKLPETHILLFGVFPRAAKPSHAYRKQIKKINDTICKLADGKNVFYCDITGKLLEKDGTLSRKIMPDLLHPGEAGYEIWAQAIMPYVNKFVDKK